MANKDQVQGYGVNSSVIKLRTAWENPHPRKNTMPIIKTVASSRATRKSNINHHNRFSSSITIPSSRPANPARTRTKLSQDHQCNQTIENTSNIHEYLLRLLCIYNRDYVGNKMRNLKKGSVSQEDEILWK